MRGVGRQIQIDAVNEYIAIHGDIDAAMRTQIEQETKELLRAQFESRLKHEAEVAAAEASTYALIKKLDEAGALEEYSWYDPNKLSLTEHIDNMMKVRRWIENDIGRVTAGESAADWEGTISGDRMTTLIMMREAIETEEGKSSYWEYVKSLGWSSKEEAEAKAVPEKLTKDQINISGDYDFSYSGNGASYSGRITLQQEGTTLTMSGVAGTGSGTYDPYTGDASIPVIEMTLKFDVQSADSITATGNISSDLVVTMKKR